MRELVVIAPREYWPVIRSGLVVCDYKVRFFVRQEIISSKKSKQKIANDPYQLTQLVTRLRTKVDALLLVVPRNRSPRSVAPGPLISGLPLGLVFANQPSDLKPWLMAATYDSPHHLWVVLAMWRRSYLRLGKRIARWMRSSNPNNVEGWYDDTITRDDLVQKLAQGPRVVVYVGHGRPRGLTGYEGLRWYHFTQVQQRQPCGTFICFACDTLKRTYGVFPFGCRLVLSGAVGAYLGAVEPLLVDANTRLAHLMGELFDKRAASDLATLVIKMHERLHDKPEYKPAYKAFSDYRIIGNPLQAL